MAADETQSGNAAKEPLPEACACESCQDAAWPQAKGHDAASLCYSGDPLKSFGGFDGSGVHLALDSHTTLCGRRVIDVPTVPRPVEPLSCRDCYEADHAR